MTDYTDYSTVLINGVPDDYSPHPMRNGGIFFMPKNITDPNAQSEMVGDEQVASFRGNRRDFLVDDGEMIPIDATTGDTNRTELAKSLKETARMLRQNAEQEANSLEALASSL